MYPGATADHIQVTNGGSEANYISTWNLVEPGDEVVDDGRRTTCRRGASRARSARRSRNGRSSTTAARWRVDTDALERLVSPRTRLIVICNPNNPTGARFDDADLDRIAAIASPPRHLDSLRRDLSRRGARRPRDADDVGTVRAGDRHERAVESVRAAGAAHRLGRRAAASSSTSLWAYHDYTTIAPGALSDALARRALEPARREAILARTRGILNAELPDPRVVAGRAPRPLQLRAARCRRDRLRALPPRHQLDRAGRRGCGRR